MGVAEHFGELDAARVAGGRDRSTPVLCLLQVARGAEVARQVLAVAVLGLLAEQGDLPEVRVAGVSGVAVVAQELALQTTSRPSCLALSLSANHKLAITPITAQVDRVPPAGGTLLVGSCGNGARLA